MFDFRKIIYKLAIIKEVILDCRYFSVGYNNRLPGQSNIWEIDIVIPPMSKTYTFEVVFEANRTDMPGTYSGTENITVGAGQTSVNKEVSSPDSTNPQEQWDMVSWEITSYTPNDGAFTIGGECWE